MQTLSFLSQTGQAISEKRPSSQPILLRLLAHVMGYPLTTSAQMLQLCPLPNSCQAPDYSPGRQSNREGLDAVQALVSSSHTLMHYQC